MTRCSIINAARPSTGLSSLQVENGIRMVHTRIIDCQQIAQLQITIASAEIISLRPTASAESTWIVVS